MAGRIVREKIKRLRNVGVCSVHQLKVRIFVLGLMRAFSALLKEKPNGITMKMLLAYQMFKTTLELLISQIFTNLI
jgi:hypothetical protein